MDTIGARLERCLDNGAPRPSKLRGGHARINAKFCHCFYGRIEVDGIDERFVVVHTIQNKIVRLRSETVDCECCAAGLAVTKGLCVAFNSAGRAAVRSPSNAWRQQCELSEVAPVQGKFGELASFHYNAGRR